MRTKICSWGALVLILLTSCAFPYKNKTPYLYTEVEKFQEDKGACIRLARHVQITPQEEVELLQQSDNVAVLSLTAAIIHSQTLVAEADKKKADQFFEKCMASKGYVIDHEEVARLAAEEEAFLRGGQ